MKRRKSKIKTEIFINFLL